MAKEAVNNPSAVRQKSLSDIAPEFIKLLQEGKEALLKHNSKEGIIKLSDHTGERLTLQSLRVLNRCEKNDERGVLRALKGERTDVEMLTFGKPYYVNTHCGKVDYCEPGRLDYSSYKEIIEKQDIFDFLEFLGKQDLAEGRKNVQKSRVNMAKFFIKYITEGFQSLESMVEEKFKGVPPRGRHIHEVTRHR